MKRYNLYLPKKLVNILKKESKKSGVPVSEIIRRSAKAYMDKINSI